MDISAETETIGQCILCETSNLTENKKFFRLLGLKPPFGVKRCIDCNLSWLSPRPTAEGYLSLYSNEYYFNGGKAVEKYEALASQRVKYFKQRIIEIERCFKRRSQLSFFEIGAATGEFLYEAKKRGHQVEGIEFSSDARNTAWLKYKLSLKAIDEEPAEQKRYDVIHMNHVLEHLPNPLETLTKCYKLLAPEGLIIIEVPQQFDNDLDRLRRLFGSRTQGTFNPYSLHHTYFFTPYTLQKMLTIAGFKIERFRTANSYRTPLWPPSIKNTLLRLFLRGADKLHYGGNIMETYGRKL